MRHQPSRSSSSVSCTGQMICKGGKNIVKNAKARDVKHVPWTSTRIESVQCSTNTESADAESGTRFVVRSSLALLCSSSCAQQSLSLVCVVRFRLPLCRPAGQPGHHGFVESVVERRAQQQDEEAEDLQAVERLPAQRQTHHPDDQRTQAVQHHTRGGADLFGHADAGEVEERDAHRVAHQGQYDERLVADLAESVQRVLQDLPRVAAEAPSRDVEHRDEEDGQDHETKKA